MDVYWDVKYFHGLFKHPSQKSLHDSLATWEYVIFIPNFQESFKNFSTITAMKILFFIQILMKGPTVFTEFSQVIPQKFSEYLCISAEQHPFENRFDLWLHHNKDFQNGNSKLPCPTLY